MAAVKRCARVLVVAGLAAAPLLTGPTAAAAPGHASCKNLGALVASEAHDQSIADEIQSLPRGAQDDLIQAVQIGGVFFGEPVPAFCQPK